MVVILTISCIDAKVPMMPAFKFFIKMIILRWIPFFFYFCWHWNTVYIMTGDSYLFMSK